MYKMVKPSKYVEHHHNYDEEINVQINYMLLSYMGNELIDSILKHIYQDLPSVL